MIYYFYSHFYRTDISDEENEGTLKKKVSVVHPNSMSLFLIL